MDIESYFSDRLKKLEDYDKYLENKLRMINSKQRELDRHIIKMHSSKKQPSTPIVTNVTGTPTNYTFKYDIPNPMPTPILTMTKI